MAKEREFNLQDRFIDYGARIVTLAEALSETRSGKHLAMAIGCFLLDIGY